VSWKIPQAHSRYVTPMCVCARAWVVGLQVPAEDAIRAFLCKVREADGRPCHGVDIRAMGASAALLPPPPARARFCAYFISWMATLPATVWPASAYGGGGGQLVRFHRVHLSRTLCASA
jgi:hypothetical protein